MTRVALAVLTCLCLALAGALAWLWVTPQGRLKGVQWSPPGPVRPALDAGRPLGGTGVELGQYVAVLDRPLFVPSRRPPPPPQAAPAPVVDPWADLRVLAVYGNGERGGMLAWVDGRIRRAKLGDSFSGWTLKAISPKGAEFAQGSEVRFVELKRSLGHESALALAAKGPASVSPEAQRQRSADEARQRVRNMNAVRAKYGFPPLPEP